MPTSELPPLAINGRHISTGTIRYIYTFYKALKINLEKKKGGKKKRLRIYQLLHNGLIFNK